MHMGRPRSKDKDLPPFLHRKPDGSFYFRGPLLGKVTFHPFKGRREAAIKAYWAFRTKHDQGEAGTFGELLDAYLTHPRGLAAVLAETTRSEYERLAPIARRKWGKDRYAMTDAEALTNPNVLKTALFDDFLAERAGQRGAVSDNRIVRFVSTVFAFAIKRSMTAHNPTHGAGYNSERPRQTEADRDALQRTIETANPAMRLMCELASVTSMDQGVIRTLRIQQVGEILDGTRRKTGIQVDWEITPYLKDIFERAKSLPGRQSSMFVFPFDRKGQPYTLRQFQDAFRYAKKTAKADFQFRDIRKWNIRQANAEGQDAQNFAGHADRRTTDRHYLNGKKTATPLR